MDLHAQLAIAKQALDDVLAMCEPKDVPTWRPSPEQRTTYVELAEVVLDGLEQLERLEQRQLFTEGRIQSVVPESLLVFVREQVKPRVNSLRTALDHLDPDGKLVRDLLAAIARPGGTRGRVRSTFEEGLQQIYQLLDRNPEWGDDHPFFTDTAYDVFESKLIQFDPDAWLDRAGELSPVRTHQSNLVLPGHVRLRLEELYRVYVFGCWLSVFGLSRAILEYCILDNLHKFNIEARWPPDREGVRKEKKLSHLIDELVDHLPTCRGSLTLLREHGNEYLHPKKSQVSKESLFQRQDAARKVVTTLVEVVEAVYLVPKET